MMSEMPGWLLREWQVYNQFEPINTAWRLEWMISKMIAVQMNQRLPRHKQVEPGKLMPQYGPAKRVEPVKSGTLYQMFRSWAVSCQPPARQKV